MKKRAREREKEGERKKEIVMRSQLVILCASHTVQIDHTPLIVNKE